MQGFYTEEVKEGGQRTGFDIVTLDGDKAKRGILARKNSRVKGRNEGKEIDLYGNCYSLNQNHYFKC